MAVKRKSRLDPVKREEMSPTESISKHGWLKTTFELCAEPVDKLYVYFIYSKHYR
ncbi:MAG: hypothetical protein K0R54_1375 [Clostridiaceae bacterium]|jgi:hypothetical protein|nr:hypothetical protein [Clostridiaceae bacterium]